MAFKVLLKMKMSFGLCCLIFLMAHAPASVAEPWASLDTDALMAKAKGGDAEAQFRLGLAHDSGSGVRRSGRKASKYYLMAAKQGHAEAQNSVGSGLQAKRKYGEALVWYERAAEQHHALAINNLAYLYDLGLGITQDKQKAFELYSQSAGLGWAEAMWNIANMYGAGEFGEIDLRNACLWTTRASKYASPEDYELLQYLAHAEAYYSGILSADELALCSREAKMWAPITEADDS